MIRSLFRSNRLLLHTQRLNYNVLGIETSCDDTCAAIVSSEGKILSEIVSSNFATHEPHGGIVPNLAARCEIQSN